MPKHLVQQKIIEAIIPSKDVDGFHPMNVGNHSSGYESSVPCTPLGCYLLIKKIEPNLNGKKAVVVGRSNLNGKPMTQLLLKENCTVTITHSKTKDLKAECLKAEKIGSYYVQCSGLCGIKHAFMPITVKVVSDEEYKEWLSEARVKFAKEEIESDKFKIASK